MMTRVLVLLCPSRYYRIRCDNRFRGGTHTGAGHVKSKEQCRESIYPWPALMILAKSRRFSTRVERLCEVLQHRLRCRASVQYSLTRSTLTESCLQVCDASQTSETRIRRNQLMCQPESSNLRRLDIQQETKRSVAGAELDLESTIESVCDAKPHLAYMIHDRKRARSLNSKRRPVGTDK